MADRLDRAGRKRAILRILMQQYKRKSTPWMTVGMVAHRMGMKSSSRLKKIIWEMIDELDNVMWTDHTGRFEVGYCPPKQLPLPERFITINGKSHQVANWVLSQNESYQ